MKKSGLLSTLSLALLASLPAHAALTTEELKVQGKIRPAACLPAIGSHGYVEYGTIPASSLTAGDFTRLATKELPIILNCDATAIMAIRITDNRASTKVTGMSGVFADSGSESTVLGLGTVAGKKIGGYSVALKQDSVIADNTPVDTLVSSDNGASWVTGSTGSFYLDRLLSFGPKDKGTVGSYRSMYGTLSITAVINKREELPVNQDIRLDGSATIEVLYL